MQEISIPQLYVEANARELGAPQTVSRRNRPADALGYLIDTNGKVVKMQVDADAVDPTKTVSEGERRKVKG